MSPLLFHVSSYAAAVSTCAVPQSSPMHEVAMVGAPGGYMKATIPAPSTTSSLEIYVRGMSKPTTTASAATGNNVSDGSSSGFTSSRSRSSSTTSNSSSSCMSSMEEEQEDRPPTWSGKDVYCLPKPSSWRLHKGKVEEFTTASAGRIMLVSATAVVVCWQCVETSVWCGVSLRHNGWLMDDCILPPAFSAPANVQRLCRKIWSVSRRGFTYMVASHCMEASIAPKYSSIV